MKILKYISLILILAITFISCEDDKDLAKINEADVIAPVLTGVTDSEEFVFVKDTVDVTWAELSWTKADYGQSLVTEYTIQIDYVDSSFANPIEFDASTETELAILVKDINGEMYGMDNNYYPSLVKANVEMRVKAVTSDYLDPVYSNVIEFYATPYDAGKPKIYFTGTYQTIPWDFTSAQTIYSINEDEFYEGYIYLTAGCEYLLNKTPTYYWGEGATSETIAVNGSNFTNTTEGTYWVEVDTTAATISMETRNWGIIGSAVDPYDWSVDINMTYDFDLNKYKVTLDLLAEEFKFRANDAWSIDFGDNGADGILDYGGANIAVPEAGNYTVYLDLSNPEKFTYELVKNN